MKQFYLLLFVIFVGLSLTACGPKIVTDEPINYQSTQTERSYDVNMTLNKGMPIAVINLNHVVITAPKGTKLGYSVNMGKVTVSGNGTDRMIIDLVTGPAELVISVTRCAEDNCPSEVHFVHQLVYP